MLRAACLRRYSSAPAISVPFPSAVNASRSRMMRSACRRPFRGGTTCSTRSVKSIMPTRSLLRTADIASTAASSVRQLALEAAHACRTARSRRRPPPA